jgi:ribosomal protein L19
MDPIRQLELENMKNSLPAFNAGDTVDVEITGIGTLSNPLIGEE